MINHSPNSPFSHLFLLGTCLLLSTSCAPWSGGQNPTGISSITIIDNSGFTETITNSDRLQQYTGVDFLCPQSFQKVLRVYSRDRDGNVYAVMTSYHQNGQIKQFLEAKNNQAHGLYQEWYANGQVKVSAQVLSGTADLTPLAEKSWLFENTCTVFAEDGSLEATIQYKKGVLDGPSLYYHPNGKVWKQLCYEKNLIEGPLLVYYDTGDLFQSAHFSHGVQVGAAMRYWPDSTAASEEHYTAGRLITGMYYNQQGTLISSVSNGSGFRSLFGFTEVAEMHEFKDGVASGLVKLFGEAGKLARSYHVKDGVKHGEEIEYDYRMDTVKPILSLSWYQGAIQGLVKTWYDNGRLESQREMSQNRKNGLASAWYRDGSLMMIEEYEQDKLVRGEYFKKGDATPVSLVFEGNGIATLFDADGHFVQKITYFNSRPQE